MKKNTFPLSGLYAITDSTLMPNEKLLAMVEKALVGGAAIVQYRDKSDNQQLRQFQATALVNLCNSYQRPLLINDDIQLAKAANAHGVHLGQGDGSVAEARSILGDNTIIGVTCHDSLALAQEAQNQGADYVAFGAFFPSATKPDARPAPIELLHDARQLLQIPVVAIGGITVDNAQQVIDSGAAMTAVVHSLFAAENIKARAQQFNQLFARAGSK
ncbi:MAG: thiamine phosphate synthase [Motiliproteus sp.]|nr:thiamine phosphate synthase [Motiliproteus sp.]MCW9053103.1 thiamine phosphate synthase [Motiliproteus sp.]